MADGNEGDTIVSGGGSWSKPIKVKIGMYLREVFDRKIKWSRLIKVKVLWLRGGRRIRLGFF